MRARGSNQIDCMPFKKAKLLSPAALDDGLPDLIIIIILVAPCFSPALAPLREVFQAPIRRARFL